MKPSIQIDFIIENYQAIKKVKGFINGLTTLVGPSEIGKSGVQRALCSALTNPRGHHFIRHGAKKCYVMIEIKQENFKLEWTKTKTTTNYKIVWGDKVTEGSKFNGDIPPVLKEFGIDSVKTFGKKPKLFWPQLAPDQNDTLFMVYDGDTDKAEVLSDLSDTAEDSKLLRLINSDLASMNSSISKEEKELSRYEDLNKELGDVTIEEEFSKTSDTLNSQRKEKDLLILLESLSNKSDYLKDFIEKSKPIEDISFELPKNIENNIKELEDLIYLFNKRSKLIKQVEALPLLPDKLSLPDIEDLQPLLDLNSKRDILSITSSLELPSSLSLPEGAEDSIYLIKDLLSYNKKIEDLLAISTLDFTSWDKIDISLLEDNYDIESLLSLSSERDSLIEVIEKSKVLDEVLEINLDSIDISPVKQVVDLYKEQEESVENISKLELEIQNLDSRLLDISKELSQFKICPACNQPLENHKE